MKRYSETQRKEFVSQFELSGLRIGVFCREQGIGPESLNRWRRQHGSCSAKSAHPSTAQWLPVVLGAGGAAQALPVQGASTYVLVGHAGRLEVPRGFDVQEVGALWQIISHQGAAKEVLA